jgi:hypothetical protein
VILLEASVMIWLLLLLCASFISCQNDLHFTHMDESELLRGFESLGLENQKLKWSANEQRRFIDENLVGKTEEELVSGSFIHEVKNLRLTGLFILCFVKKI